MEEEIVRDVQGAELRGIDNRLDFSNRERYKEELFWQELKKEEV